jgi:hypothetical protein
MEIWVSYPVTGRQVDSEENSNIQRQKEDEGVSRFYDAVDGSAYS